MAPPIPPTKNPETVSHYLNHLPAIFQQGETSNEVVSSFINQFLTAFEKILTGLGDVDEPGLEEKLEGIINPNPETGEFPWRLVGIHRYFDPAPDISDDNQRTPKEFLEWLASWVALSLREDWEESQKRRFISQVVPLYRKRGTKAGLEDMLRAYTGGIEVKVYEFQQPFQVGVTSTINIDTMVGNGLPHYFIVRLIQSKLNDLDFNHQKQVVRAIVDQEKPAHTFYDLFLKVATTLQVGVESRSEVGVSTILGDIPSKEE